MVTSPNTALSRLNAYKERNYQCKRIQLSSPLLHIGSDIRLSPLEYIQDGERVYLPNQDALARALQNPQSSKVAKALQRAHTADNRLFKEYTQIIETQGSTDKKIIKIKELLTGDKGFGSNWVAAIDSEGNLVFPKAGISQKWVDGLITSEIFPMIRNGFGELYIPGTSIKGAIRTAIAYHLLKYQRFYQVPTSIRRSEIEKELGRRMKSKPKDKKFANEFFMDDLFSDFNLHYEEYFPQARNCSNTDFMRAVKVTDSAPLLTNKNKLINSSIVTEVVVSSFSGADSRLAKCYNPPIYVESVRNVQTEFTISLDTEMLSWFIQNNEGMKIPFQSIDDILKICSKFAQAQWNHECRYWHKITANQSGNKRSVDLVNIHNFYRDNCPYSLRLGWASGMIGTTVGLCFSDQLRQRIRETYCPKKAPGFEAPKSRRTALKPHSKRDKDMSAVFGWVKFTPLENPC